MRNATSNPTYIEDTIDLVDTNDKTSRQIKIYCDSSYLPYDKTNSYTGCSILVDGEFVHQSTTKIEFDPKDNQQCERAAIKYSTNYARLFFKNENVTIYNDSFTTVHGYPAVQNNECVIKFKYVSRDDEFQWVPDKLSKGMIYPYKEELAIPLDNSDLIALYDYSTNDKGEVLVGCQILKNGQYIHQSTTKIGSNLENDVIFFVKSLSSMIAKDGETVKVCKSSDLNSQIVAKLARSFKYYDGLPSTSLPKCRFERFSGDIRCEIAANERNILYVKEVRSTKTRKYYNLVIASPTNIVHEEEFGPIVKGGDGLHFKIAEQIHSKLCSDDFIQFLEMEGIQIQDSYFLITNELSGLTFNNYMTNSIIPKSIRHKVIGDRRFYSNPSYFSSDEYVFQEFSRLLNN